MEFNTQMDSFYEKPFSFSYSGINKLLFSPIVFYNHYILKEREDRVDAHLVAGKAIHCLILEGDRFNDQFLVTPSKLPTANNKMVVDQCFRAYIQQSDKSLILDDFEQVILDTLVSIDLHQKLKTDESRVEKLLNDLNKKYFEYLKSKGDKTLIGQEMYDSCKETVEYLKANDRVLTLLQFEKSSTDTFKVLNEEFLYMELDDYDFGLKGVLDNVVIDYDNKMLFVNDLKTTAKPIQNFAESVDYYNYWMQATIYKKLAIANYLKEEDLKDWNIFVTFIVVDKFNMVYPFQVSNETLLKWEGDLKKILEEVNYHYSNKDYTLPYELASGNFKL
jgi:hypothetical protein